MARHPLDGAFRRVDRAREHTAHLKRRADAVRQEQEDALIFKVHPTMPDQMQAFISRNVPPHFMLGILTGEICYNLRAALDYLIFRTRLHRFRAVPRGHTVSDRRYERRVRAECG